MIRVPSLWLALTLCAAGCELVAGITDRTTAPGGAAGVGGDVGVAGGGAGGEGASVTAGGAPSSGAGGEAPGGAGGSPSGGGSGEGGSAGAGVDHCASSPCQNGARCINSTNSFECDCSGPWAGELCDLPMFEPINEGIGSEVHGISADGKVVAGLLDTSDGTRAFRFTHDAGLEVLKLVPNAIGCEGRGISRDGKVVVGSCYFSDATQRAVYWTDAEAVSFTPNETQGEAYGTNQDGSVIVGKDSHGAFRWTAAGSLSLGLGVATATNAEGTIVAGGSRSDGQAFRYSATTGRVDVPFKDLPQSSIATAVDESGSTTVGFLNAPDGTLLPFRAEGTAAGAVLGIRSAQAYAVNADGSIVAGGGFDAWVFRNGKTKVLVDALANAGTTTVPQDYWFNNAFAISADGLVVGGAASVNGTLRGWIVRLRAKDLP